MGQPPLEEVVESPALEQAQPQALGLTPLEDEITSSPQKTLMIEHQERVVEAQSEEEPGLLPDTSNSMGSQVFSQAREETLLAKTPEPNKEMNLCVKQSSDKTETTTPLLRS